MQKEVLTLSKIACDLHVVAGAKKESQSVWRFTFIIPFTMVAVAVAVIFKIWLGLIIFSVAAYHIFWYALEYREHLATKKRIRGLIDRGEIAISTEKFSHFSIEVIYEPHLSSRRFRRGVYVDMDKSVKFMYFMSGASWRVPLVDEHYKWSKDYYVSTKGLENISLPEDEFFYVTLQGEYDISYVYPLKFFTLDEILKQKAVGE